MKTRTILRLILCIITAMVLFTGTTPTHAAETIYLRSPVVISQLYGGAEVLNSSYSSDYVELFNRGTATVNLDGWSVQIAESGSNRWKATPLSGTLAPGHYYLVQQGAEGQADLPTPDAQGSTPLNVEVGKVALVRSTTLLTEECPVDGLEIADLVGYGEESCAEANPTHEMGATEALVRQGAGCRESDNNANDFTLAAPNPHNRAAPAEECRGPIVLVSFTTTNERDYIDIRWETSFEESTRGYNLYRGTDTIQSPVRINPAEIPAHGGTGQVALYSHEDYDVETYVTYYYYLEEVDISDVPTVVEVRSILRENPSSVTLAGMDVTSAPINGGVIIATLVGMSLAAGWVWRRRQ